MRFLSIRHWPLFGQTPTAHVLLTVLLVAGAMLSQGGEAGDQAPRARQNPEMPHTIPESDSCCRPDRANFALRNGRTEFSYNIQTFSINPGRTLSLSVATQGNGEAFVLRTSDGLEHPSENGSWRWKAPMDAGLHRFTVLRTDQIDSIVVNVFVTVPATELRRGYLNGYLIGQYPRPPRPIYRRPEGFIEVTPENLDVFVSPHFRLGQFVCKQQSGYPKYLVLDPLILNKLEYLLELVNEAGYEANTFFVMSGYRTPSYNRAIGNVALSRHVWGAAADIFIDEDGDGYMDDINGDGKSDIGDVRILYAIADREAAKADYAVYLGGLGTYRANPRHGPYLHVDVRGRRARWAR